MTISVAPTTKPIAAKTIPNRLMRLCVNLRSFDFLFTGSSKHQRLLAVRDNYDHISKNE